VCAWFLIGIFALSLLNEIRVYTSRLEFSEKLAYREIINSTDKSCIRDIGKCLFVVRRKWENKVRKTKSVENENRQIGIM
jgi:hypothetical protein